MLKNVLSPSILSLGKKSFQQDLDKQIGAVCAFSPSDPIRLIYDFRSDR